MRSLPQVAFVDRDGVINAKAAEGAYVTRPEDLVILPGAATAVRALNDLGSRVVVVTNQRGIALGHMTEVDLAAVHDAMTIQLARSGARLDGVFHCPHDAGQCDCRKPEVGLFLRAEREVLGVRIVEAVMIGDGREDMEAAARLGIPRVLIADSTQSSAQALAGELAVDHIAPSLLGAVCWLRDGT